MKGTFEPMGHSIPSSRTPPAKRALRGWFQGEHSGNGRIRLIIVAMFVVAALLSARLGQLQVVQSGRLAAMARAEHTSSVVVPAERGEVFDSEGNLLVGNMTVYDVFADPALVTKAQRSTLAQQLAKVLNVSETTMMTDLDQPLQFVYLAKGVSVTTKDALENLGIAGVGVIPRQESTFVKSPILGDSLAANLLGFVNAKGQGQYGVEQYYNPMLTGTNGTTSQITDLQGNPILLSNGTNVAPKKGTDLRLGLDSTVQYYAEIALQKEMNISKAQSGMVMLMQTNTGLIKAWAESPSYNANAYGSANMANYKDIAVSNLFEPGSVMKAITFAGGLNNNAITPAYTFNEGPVTIDGATIHDWDNKAHGNVSMQWVLDDSLNDGAIKVQQLEGAQAFYNNLQDFGIGAPTGIDVAGEVNTPLPAESSESALTLAEQSFGQAVLATPVEMLAGINAIANNGVWVQPHAVNQFYNPNTGQTTNFKPVTRRVISASADATLRTMMMHVVQDPGAEGFNAKIAGFTDQVAGKTGTASVAINGTYSQTVVIVSFAGFIPVSDPNFTLMVVLNDPGVPSADAFGSLLAAPLWQQVAQVAIDQWHITP